MNLTSLFSTWGHPAEERRRDWARVVSYRESTRHLESLGPENLDALEISGGSYWKKFPFKSLSRMDYPEYDICRDKLDRQFDLIIADQVFEVLSHPWRAAKNVHDMLKPGGTFIITTPFLVKLCPHPQDCTRWTETGLTYLLEDAGFDVKNIETGAWGNRKCIIANFKRWEKLGRFSSLKNEPRFPICVWAFARKGL